VRHRPDTSKRLDIDTAIKHLRAGRVVAYPTETFLGLAVDAMKPDAVDLLRALKGRGDKPISVIVAVREMVSTVTAALTPAGEALADAFWPGPLTLVVPARETVPLNLRAGGPTVGLRVSSHIVAHALAAGLDGPITSTSCNRAGGPEPTRPDQVDADVMRQIAGWVDGVAPGGRPSTIVDLSGEFPDVIRPGAISLERLRAVVPEIDQPRP